MIKVHHLNDSRSQRILWLMEELEHPYTLVSYQRDARTSRAPDTLKKAHPLGKSPVIEDGETVIAESGAIIEYVLDHYGEGRLAPAPDSAEHYRYVEWLHYAEGSGMVPFLLALYVGFLGEAGAPLMPLIQDETGKHLGYINTALEGRPWLMGEAFTGADINISFMLEAARLRGMLEPFPGLDAYVQRFQGRAAYRRALKKGGAYRYGPQSG